MHYRDDGPRVGLVSGLVAGILVGAAIALLGRVAPGGRASVRNLPPGKRDRGFRPPLERLRRDLAAVIDSD